jgi:hypothetical protein
MATAQAGGDSLLKAASGGKIPVAGVSPVKSTDSSSLARNSVVV